MARQTFYVNARAIIERETSAGTEVLLQVRDKPGQPRRLEFPGGQLDPFEGILTGLAREVREETGLTLTRVLDETNRREWTSEAATVETLTPFFVYQTLRGPVDSVGFFFRCQASGELTRNGDEASGHKWWGVRTLKAAFDTEPERFDWLTQAAFGHYLTHNPA
ncbi:NUDIX hydrolase [Deinococcus sp.]|uniref:NUDIX domain-containing protein n=1 Tax=Deinococcus sp. TaxID=47478 RepID=UPI0025FD96D0|nr:NUDIX hydrolase [Deinococcus sp.]